MSVVDPFVINTKRKKQQLATGATQMRSIQDWLDDGAIKAKDWGCKGDDTTDDTGNFQAALATGRPVVLPDGVMQISDDCLIGNFAARGQYLIGVGNDFDDNRSTIRMIAPNKAVRVVGDFCGVRDVNFVGINAARTAAVGTVGLVVGTGPSSANKCSLFNITAKYFLHAGIVINGLQNASVVNVEAKFNFYNWLIQNGTRNISIRNCNGSDRTITVTASGTATGGSTTTIVITQTPNSAYVGQVVRIISGAGAGQAARITAQDGVHTLTFAALGVAAAAGSVYAVEALDSFYPVNIWALAPNRRQIYIGMPSLVNSYIPLNAFAAGTNYLALVPSNITIEDNIFERGDIDTYIAEIAEFYGHLVFRGTEFTRTGPGGYLIRRANFDTGTTHDSARSQRLILDNPDFNQTNNAGALVYNLVKNESTKFPIYCTGRSTVLCVEGSAIYEGDAANQILDNPSNFDGGANYSWTSTSAPNCDVDTTGNTLRIVSKTTSQGARCLPHKNLSWVPLPVGKFLDIEVVISRCFGEVNSNGYMGKIQAELSITPFVTDVIEFAPSPRKQIIRCRVPISDQTTPTTVACLNGNIRIGVTSGWTPVTGTAQAGTSTTITLQAGTTLNPIGRRVRQTNGAGSGEFRYVTDWNPTTLVATVDTAWANTPSATTTYNIDPVIQVRRAIVTIADGPFGQTTTTWTGALSSLPFASDWQVGDVLSRLTAKGGVNDIVSVAGTAGTLTGVTATFAAGSAIGTVSSAALLRLGNRLNIAGGPTGSPYIVRAIAGLAVTLDKPVDVAATAGALTFYPPVIGASNAYSDVVSFSTNTTLTQTAHEGALIITTGATSRTHTLPTSLSSLRAWIDFWGTAADHSVTDGTNTYIIPQGTRARLVYQGPANWAALIASQITGLLGQQIIFNASLIPVAATIGRWIPFKAIGTDLGTLTGKTVFYPMERAWKAVSYQYKIAGSSSPSIVVTANMGVGGSPMTGVNALSLTATTVTAGTITAGNAGAITDALELSFGAIGGTLTEIDFNIWINWNG
jgi:hypothetical protein